MKFISWINWNFDQKESGDKKEQKESMNIHGGIEMGAVSPASGFERKHSSIRGSVQLQQQHPGPVPGLRARCASACSLA